MTLNNEFLQINTQIYSKEENLLDATDNSKEFLVFSLAGELFFVEQDLLDKIIIPPIISRLPKQEECLEGIANIGGQLTLIINLNYYLNLQKNKVTDHSRIVLVNLNKQITGFVADEILGPMNFNLKNSQNSIFTKDKLEKQYIQGLFAHQNKEYSWLDLRNIINSIK